MKKTVIYALVSLVLVLGGIIVVLNYRTEVGAAIGASIVAGGLASLSFSIIRYFDDKDAVRLRLREEEKYVELREGIEALAKAVQSLRLDDAGRKRIRSRRPREDVARAIEAIDKRRTIEIDSMGISLRPFYEDWMDHLLVRGGVRARLLVMDPRTGVFERFCTDQGIDREKFVQDIAFITSNVLNLERSHSCMKADQGRTASQSPSGRTGAGVVFQIELRWDPGFQSVTLTRVNEILFVRSRLVSEARNPNVFFEVYRNGSSERPYFETYRKYFEEVWRRSFVPTEKELNEVTAGSKGRIGEGRRL